MPEQLWREEIIERAALLPAFPQVVRAILETIEDDHATMGKLAQLLKSDPVIAGRVLSLANSAALGHHGGETIHSLGAATSLIGLAKIREIVMTVGMAEFAKDSRMSSYFWEHSVAVAVAAQELARFAGVSPDYAFIGGLLHDVGQLWMARFYPLEFQMVRGAVSEGRCNIIAAESQYFGEDHCHVGAIVAEYWGLPGVISEAVFYHHEPDQGLGNKLVPVIHVAEVLSNALDLTRRNDNQVSNLSQEACDALGIDWSLDFSYLFGKIEARTESACRVFRV